MSPRPCSGPTRRHLIAGSAATSGTLALAETRAQPADPAAKTAAHLVGRSIADVAGGDLNIDRTSPEYDTLQAVLGVETPDYRGHAYSRDPKRDGRNAGRNGDSPQQLLDHVLPRSGRRGATSRQNTVLTPTSPAWTAGGESYRDYFDHYPVAALVRTH